VFGWAEQARNGRNSAGSPLDQVLEFVEQGCEFATTRFRIKHAGCWRRWNRLRVTEGGLEFDTTCHHANTDICATQVLVLSGFKKIEIVDLDTIDVSNLNRQFLFRREHVGMSKALVAAEQVKKFNPSAKLQIVAHHGNIKDKKFGADFIQKFDLVFNALDNIEARRHVNRVCIAVDKPLIDGGTQVRTTSF
jgi:hypothetical protein